ncbi:hypothetical protein FEM48_Zijuj10G0016100 [Ziziphus jujuba var. spinosa]|uniref:Disease resistance protein At3g14460 n=1 Tax=Ziziphus jujuba var. spinosa TaxID=714518 RepID=A0A978UKI7_ZIZJJ|nr:hypothetical protein FEM48_Zijuj10G0016100 [Ziziphus jujuba var. spinosa]
MDLFPNLNNLSIHECGNLESFTLSDDLLSKQGLTSLTCLEITHCPKFISFPEGGLNAPNLTKLAVEGYKKLKHLPQKMHKLLPCLQSLWICDCPEVETFPENGLHCYLDTLWISNCSKLIGNRMK